MVSCEFLISPSSRKKSHEVELIWPVPSEKVREEDVEDSYQVSSLSPSLELTLQVRRLE